MTVERLPGTPYASGEGRIARSWRLTRAAWQVVVHNDTLQGLAVLGVLGGLAGFALLLVLGGVFSDAAISRGHFLLVGGLALVAIIAAQSVVRQTYIVALYRYATTRTAEGPFSEDDLRAPFAPKRGRSRFS